MLINTSIRKMHIFKFYNDKIHTKTPWLDFKKYHFPLVTFQLLRCPIKTFNDIWTVIYHIFISFYF